jgi:hypothetical protein
LRKFPRPRLLGLEQPHVLDRDHSLVGKDTEERNLLFRKRPNLHATNQDRPDRISFTQQRSSKRGSMA